MAMKPVTQEPDLSGASTDHLVGLLDYLGHLQTLTDAERATVILADRLRIGNELRRR